MEMMATSEIPNTTLRPKSNAHYLAASNLLPLGVCDSYRYWGPEGTIYIKEGKGAIVRDIDDNQYIDLRLGYGPIILGHSDKRVDSAVQKSMSRGGLFALATETEYEVARLISSIVPGAEMVRFANSGTEAVMMALRIARAATKKDGYVIVEGAFHGLFDSVMWQADIEGWDGSKQKSPNVVAFGNGVPEGGRQWLRTLPLNDLNAVEELFKRESDHIACFIIEAIMGNCCGSRATLEYMKGLRELCTKHGVLLVMDEVKTGFRVGPGGAQELYSVKPDLCTFAKAMANGFPISAVAGRREIMKEINASGVVAGGTYTGHLVGISAALETISLLRDGSILKKISGYGSSLQGEIGKVLRKYNIPVTFSGHPSMFNVMLMQDEPTNYRDWKKSNYKLYERIAVSMRNFGLLCEPDLREPWFICEAHCDIPVEHISSRFEAAVSSVIE